MKRIPYGKQNITESDITAVINTLESDFLTQGPKIHEFEEKFSEYVDSKYAVAVNNATSGLHLSVLSLGLRAGDRVITTPITFASTANCIRFVGGQVWFADIDPDTYLLSIDSVENLINSKPRGFFKGIIPVDFGGLPVNLEEFRSLADKHNLWIIEDACHAPGGYFIDSKKNPQKCGNCKYADIGIFSFHPVKHIACGEGGMITTDSKELYDKLILLRTHGITKNDINKDHGDWYYEMNELGYNYRLTDIQASLGITQLKKNVNGVYKRNNIANNYRSAFKNHIKFQKISSNYFNAYHLFIIEVNERKRLYDFLKRNNIFSQVHYIPLHTLPYYRAIGYQEADLISAENYYKNCLSLPMYPSLDKEDQDFVISKVLEFMDE